MIRELLVLDFNVKALVRKNIIQTSRYNSRGGKHKKHEIVIYEQILQRFLIDALVYRKVNRYIQLLPNVITVEISIQELYGLPTL